MKGAPHENVTRNFPTADIQPDPGHKHELERGDCAVIAFLLQMNTVYVRDKGDDKNDGLTEQTAVRSFKHAIKIAIRSGAHLLNLRGAPMERLNREILSKDREGEEGVTRKGRPTDFLFFLHLILGIAPALVASSMDFASVL